MPMGQLMQGDSRCLYSADFAQVSPPSLLMGVGCWHEDNKALQPGYPGGVAISAAGGEVTI